MTILIISLLLGGVFVVMSYQSRREHLDQRLVNNVQSWALSLGRELIHFQQLATEVAKQANIGQQWEDSRAWQSLSATLGISVVGMDGSLLAQVGEPIPEGLWPERLQDDNFTLGLLQQLAGRQAVITAMPVFDSQGIKQGVELIAFDLAPLSEMLGNMLRELSVKVQVAVVSRTADGVHLLAEPWIEQNPMLRRPADDTIETAISEDTSGLQSSDCAGTPCVLVGQRLIGSDWFLLTYTEANELYAPARVDLLYAVAALLSLGLLGVAVTWIWFRTFPGRISREAYVPCRLVEEDRQIHEQREQLRLRILEEVAQGIPLPQQLESLVHSVESMMPGCLCSMLLLDDSGSCLRRGAAPSLPEFYNAAVDGLQIGPGVGSCGAAAYADKLTIVEDIQQHPNWANFAQLAQRARLAACWSLPIHDSRDKVVGTFAIYHREPNTPRPEELDLVASLTDLAGMAIERTHHQQRLAKEETWRRILLEQSRDGIVILNESGKVHDANKGFADMLGYSLEEVYELYVWDWEAVMSKEQLDFALEEVDPVGDRFETKNRRKDGSLIDVEITSTAAVFDNRKLICNYSAKKST